MQKIYFDKLKIVDTDKSNVWCYCVFHNDTTRPNLSVSLDEAYYGKYRCWACGREGWLNDHQINTLLASKAPVYRNNRHKLSTRWHEFVIQCNKNLDRFPLLKLELANSLNVSLKSLQEWRVGYDGESYIIPMYRNDLHQYHRQHGVCGAQRRYSDGSKKAIPNSKLGYMYSIDGLGMDYGIFICEGFSDAISIYDLDFNVIARPNCHFTDGVLEHLDNWVQDEDEPIIIIPDNDKVGMDGAYELMSIIEEYYPCSIFGFSGVKDIREYILKVGKDKVRRELEYVIQ